MWRNTERASLEKKPSTPSIDSDESGDNSADLPDNFHSNPSDRGDYHDEPTDVDPLSTNPRAQTMAIVQC